MRTTLAAEAVSLGEAVTAAVERAGGFEIVRSAERDPAARLRSGELLDGLDVWSLRPREDGLELEAAAAVCRAVGGYALPYPVAERLAADPRVGVGALALVGPRPHVNMADLELDWAVGDLDGRQAAVRATHPALGTRLGAFVCPVELGPWTARGGIDLSMTLQCWVLLGMLEAATAMTCVHVGQRRQFGSSLSSFQGLRFRLTDSSVAVQSLAELAKYTLWSVRERRPSSLTDAIALRLAALEAADHVFAAAHQLHGAIGFCDEISLSWLSRHSQPIRRLPFGRARLEQQLYAHVLQRPLDGPYAGAAASVTAPSMAPAATQMRVRAQA